MRLQVFESMCLAWPEGPREERVGVSAFRKGRDATLDLDLVSIGIHRSRSSIRRLALRNLSSFDPKMSPAKSDAHKEHGGISCDFGGSEIDLLFNSAGPDAAFRARCSTADDFEEKIGKSCPRKKPIERILETIDPLN